MPTTSPEQARPTPPGAGEPTFAAAPPAPPRGEAFWRRRWVLGVGAGLLALLLAGGGFAAGFAIGAGANASATSDFAGDRGDRFGPRGDGVPPGTPSTHNGTDSDAEDVVPNS